MRLYEFEAKRLFKKHGIPVLDSVLVDENSFEELEKVTYPVVVKAQTFIGGRGKAGLIKPADNRKDVEDKIKNMLGRKHGAFEIKSVLVEKKVEVEREVYIAATIDRLEHKPVLILSNKGGIDIEETARQSPDAIFKYYINPGGKVLPFFGRKCAAKLGFKGPLLNKCAGIVVKLYSLFLNLDCKLVEINPLALTKTGGIFALDAKVNLDEDAMFRHPELKELGITARHEVGELTEREKFAKSKGIPYVDLDGDIGVFPGGAGFGIAAIDLIQHYGGKPANFMDSGGAPTQEKLRAMLGLLIENPRVKAIFGARFGGISRCDDWAKALVQYVKENRPEKPMIMRMTGNMEEEGRKILEQAKRDEPELFKKIKVYSVDTPIEEVIKETIRAAAECK